MYSLKIDPEFLRELHRLKQKGRGPIARQIREAIRKYLDEHSPNRTERR